MPARLDGSSDEASRGVQTGMQPAGHGFAFGNHFTRLGKVHRAGPLSLRTRPFRYGLCGGMCYAALDYFHAGLQPPTLSAPPAGGTALLRYLERRQLDSWRGPCVPARTVLWMWRSDRAVARATLGHELPRLLSILDRGEPAVILLIRNGRRDPTLNHQVVVTGYERAPEGDCLTLTLYDPNHPGIATTLCIDTAASPTQLRAVESTGELWRAFFVQPYRPRVRGLPAAADTSEQPVRRG